MEERGTIKHNNFCPDIQGLGYIPPGKTKTIISQGIVAPKGERDFGIINRVEIIRVVFGEIDINGKSYAEGDKCLIEPGTQVVFKGNPDTVSAYFCQFPNETE